MELKELLKERLRLAHAAIAEYQAMLAKDPVDALHFIDGLVAPAIQARVLGAVLKAHEKGRGVDALGDYATDNVLRLASRGAIRSTGALDASLAAEEVRAWHEVVEMTQEALKSE